MKTRQFGNTGLQVSELIIGAGAIGGLFINADETTRRAALQSALAAGINWIDTAASYGQGRSEQALGSLLTELGSAREQPYLSTKFSVDPDQLNDLAGQIEASVTASLNRLQRTSVTLLQLHNPLAHATDSKRLAISEVLKPGGVLDVMQDLKRQGLCDHIGLTGLGEADCIIQALDTAQFESAQVYYNLLNPSAGQAMPADYTGARFDGVLAACERNQVAPMAIRIMSAGVIATDSRHGREAPLTAGDTVASETEKAAKIAAALGDRYGSRAQAAVRFVLGEPRFACLVVGFEKIDYLNEAIAAQKMGALPAQASAQIQAVYDAGF